MKREAIALGLGGNIGDVAANLKIAITMLNAHEAIHIQRISALYQTPAWGEVNQADFINICAIGETTLSPIALLDNIKIFEKKIGRTKTYRWGPRVIDIDILLWGEGREMEMPNLIIPHKEMTRRAFVLVPLEEIAPKWKIGQYDVRTWCEALPLEEREAIQKREELDWPPFF